MTIEAQSNQQSSEGISPQQYETFNQLQAKITERLRPHSFIIVATSNDTDPPNGYHLSLDTDRVWGIGFGREGEGLLNESGKPVKLLSILEQYAFIRNSERLDILMRDGKTREHSDEKRKLRESVNSNPRPLADSLLADMENRLEKLRREDPTI